MAAVCPYQAEYHLAVRAALPPSARPGYRPIARHAGDPVQSAPLRQDTDRATRIRSHGVCQGPAG